MSIAGIVTYKIGKSGTLEGRWTHQSLQGRMGTELAWDGTPGKLAGTYKVEIKTPDHQAIFEGSLTIEKIGEAYTLTWVGFQLLPQQRAAMYSGVGMLEASGRLIATFQEDEARTGR